MNTQIATPPLEAVTRLTKDLNQAAVGLTIPEVRYLVDAYYKHQDDRKAAANQAAALGRSGEPHDVINWLAQQNEHLEGQVKRALTTWCAQQPICQWSMSIVGIGPVISAGLAAHIDIRKAPTAGHIWRFAGLDPTVSWGKGEKRPWNAALKVLCWKIGESFVKVSNNPADVYGKVYVSRKEDEAGRNERGEYAEIAAGILTAKKIGKETDAYKAYSQGKLPPGHIHARAKRYAVKLFLSHFHHVAYEITFDTPPPKPYIIQHGGHVHFMAPPNWK
jgi:hypothetical protein